MYTQNSSSTQWNMWRSILIMGALLLCAGLTASAAYAAVGTKQKTSKQTTYEEATQATCSTGAFIVSSPNVASGHNDLKDIAAISAEDIWAVGEYSNASGISQSLIQHWDGTTWSIVPVPSFQGNNGLNGVAAISAADVWAVGYGTSSGLLTLHWDGLRWSNVPTPNVSSSGLRAVTAISTNDVWAIGARGYVTLTIHWDGRQWSVVPSPNHAGHNNFLNGIDAVSANDVWAVGVHTYYDVTKEITYVYGLALHWNGTRWDLVPMPENWWLLDVTAISSNDIWAVGKQGRGFLALSVHWDGTRWSAITNGLQGAMPLQGVSAASPTEVWAVGSTDFNLTGNPVMFRWNGSQWTTLPNTEPTVQGYLNDVVALSSGDVRGVGSYTDPYSGTGATLVQQWNGTTTAIVPSPSVKQGGNYLSDVKVISASNIWAVGRSKNPYARDRTLTLHWDGQRWRPVPSPNSAMSSTDSRLSAVDAVSPQDIWAVGSAGNVYYFEPLIFHWDGGSWSMIPGLPTEIVLNSVEAIASNNVWAAGSAIFAGVPYRPIFLHWDGASWNYQPLNVPRGNNFAFNSISAVSANDIWAVGINNDRTFTAHYDGTSWSVVPSPNVGAERNILRAVKAFSSNDVWAVGYYGRPGTGQALIMRWNGAQWSVIPGAAVGTDSFLFDVEPVGPNDVWAVGNYLDGGPQKALVEHWNGSTWSHIPHPNVGTAASFLFGIAALSEDELWAVGDFDQGPEHWTLTERLVPPNFSDLPGSTFEPFINCLACRGIISGYADGTFRPNNDVTRGQLSKIVSNSANFQEDPGPQIFEDVPPGSTFYEWVQRLARRGHISGYPCGGAGEPCNPGNKPYFRPNANATRAQISKIVSNARGYNDPAGAQIFEDVPPTHGFYEWIQRLTRHGAMGGYECGGAGEPCGAERRPYFRPQNNATRGQTSKIVSNTFFPECAP